VNGRVLTGSETHPYAEALAIKGTQILGMIWAASAAYDNSHKANDNTLSNDHGHE
jgi:predicted amidohydrolase YtcJ